MPPIVYNQTKKWSQMTVKAETASKCRGDTSNNNYYLQHVMRKFPKQARFSGRLGRIKITTRERERDLKREERKIGES